MSAAHETEAPLPNLVIAGVAKAGTTSLFNYLAQHPAICASQVKEIGFFTKVGAEGQPLRSVAWYRGHFAHCAGEPYRLEASPSYCHGGRAVAVPMRTLLPKPRVVLMLRDPVARLWSAYTFGKSRGGLTESDDPDVFLTRWEQGRAEDIASGRRPRASHLSAGWYADWLPDWFDTYGDDLRVVFAEHLAADPRAVVSDLCMWLDLDIGPVHGIDVGVHNPTLQPRSRGFARVAYRTRRRTNRLFAAQPLVRSALRQVYRSVNTTDQTERLPGPTRDRLTALYAPSNATVSALLRDRGYTDLPGWLA